MQHIQTTKATSHQHAVYRSPYLGTSVVKESPADMMYRIRRNDTSIPLEDIETNQDTFNFEDLTELLNGMGDMEEVAMAHNDLALLQLQYERERFALEKKFMDLREEAYERRADAVYDVETGQIKQAGFWMQAMKNHPNMALYLTEKDLGALAYLVDVRVEYIEKGYNLEFDFAPNNPFFKNSTLAKTIHLRNMYR